MTRESKYFKEIERLLGIGYEPRDIIKITGIPRTTVYRVVDKLRRESRIEFKNLMRDDFLYKYQLTLENYSKTIQECNEEIVSMKKKYASLELLNMQALEGIPESKPMAKATLLANLNNIQSNRTTELTRLVAQRDKASTEKAKVYNQGPVVNAVHEWVNSNPPPMGELPRIPELDKVNPPPKTEPTKLNSQKDIDNAKDNEEDERVMREMEDE